MVRRISAVLLASGLAPLLDADPRASQASGRRVIEPLVVDLAANGFSLTSLEAGVDSISMKIACAMRLRGPLLPPSPCGSVKKRAALRCAISVQRRHVCVG